MTGRLRICTVTMIRAVVLLCLAEFLATAAAGQTIIWTDTNARRIQRKDVNGGELRTIVQFQSPQTASVIHYDAITAKLYYRIHGTAPVFFQRANLDGAARQNIATPTGGNFTLNVESRKLYWINTGQSPSTIYRSELNGAGIESHTYGSCCVTTLEAFGDDLFFGAGLTMTKGIWRADPDGSNEQFLHSTGQPMDLAYDPVDNKLYCATINAIVRMNPGGTGFETVLQLPSQLASTPEQVVVDARGRKMYWAARVAKVIQRSNLDGSSVEDFVTATDVENPDFDIAGLTILYSSTPIPTLSGWGLMAMGVILLGIGVVILRRRADSSSSAI